MVTKLDLHACRLTKLRSDFYVVDCPTCGRVGGRNLEGDALAIALRHQEVGGFERPSR